MYKYKFSICTACYNGEKLLNRVYDSLKKQTYKDFEWIIINDASTDNTDQLVKHYIEKAEFPIRYSVNENNKGLGGSLEKAVSMVQGELFISADCDDEFVENALERFLSVWETYSKEEKKDLKGVVCNTQDQYDNFIGTPFPKSPLIADDFKMRFKYKIRGEKWAFTRTDLMKQYSFLVPGYKFITLAYVWMQMSAKYKSVYINDILRIYYVNEVDNESMETQQIKDSSKWADGTAYYYGFMLSKYSSLILKNSFIAYLKNFIHYMHYSHLARISLSRTLSDLKGFRNKALFLLMLLPGYLYIFLKKSLIWEKIKKTKILCAA